MCSVANQNYKIQFFRIYKNKSSFGLEKFDTINLKFKKQNYFWEAIRKTFLHSEPTLPQTTKKPLHTPLKEEYNE